MLAPASLRSGSSPGGADRRRTLRMVVIAVIAGLLAIAIPVALAARADGDDGPAATAATPTGADAAAPEPGLIAPGTSGSPVGSVEVTSTTASAPPSDPVPTDGATSDAATSDTATSDAATSDTATSDAEIAAPVPAPAPTAAASPDADGASAVPTEAASAAEPSTTAAPVSDDPADWMEALRPQVDPEGLATWVFEARGAWGASDGHTVYIDPDVPDDKRWSVMVHEYGHVLQVRRYGSLDETARAMNAIVGAGPTDQGPTESNADCIAELLGATWTDYGCQDALRPAAAALVADDQGRSGAAQSARG